MDAFTALAEPTRREIIELLAKKGEMNATDIYNKFTSSPPAISQHLKILREAKLVDMEKRSQKRIYSLNAKGLLELEMWIEKMTKLWNKRFDKLDKILAEMK